MKTEYLGNVKIIGHEANTLSKLNEFLRKKVDAIEVDIRPHGGELYLSHDKIKKSKKYLKLSEALSLISGKTGVMLDVKEPLNATVLVNCIEDFKGTIYISGTYTEVIKKVKEVFPRVIALVSVQDNKTDYKIPDFADGVSIRYTILNRSLVNELREMGYYIATWTVNKQSDMRNLVYMGVDAIITDKPPVAIKLESAEIFRSSAGIFMEIKKRIMRR